VKHIRIDCADFVKEIGNLLDGGVDPQLRAHLEGHLAECKACTVVYDSTRKTIRILADTEVFELSPAELKAGTENIMARIRELKKSRGGML
jgi:predicted anti-sigma-YlaC factor YlaD